MNGLPMLRANALAEVSAGGQGDPLWTAYWPMSAHSIWFDSFLVAIMLVAGLTLALLSAWTRIGKRPRAALGLLSIALSLPALTYVVALRPSMVDGAVVLKQDRLVAMQRDISGNRYIRTIRFSDVVNATVVEDPTGNVVATFKTCMPKPQAIFVFLPQSTGRSLVEAMRTTEIRKHAGEPNCQAPGLPI